MILEELIQRRLSSQNLSVHAFTKPEEIVSWFGAIQSQDAPGAMWAISQRLGLLSKQKIDEAVDKGTILRTHVMRPTWHFVASKDIRWLLTLTATRVKKAMGTYNKVLGLDKRVFEQSERIITKELKNNNYLTRTELGTLLKNNGITWQGNGLAHIVANSELNGVICSGPKKGKLQTYALLSERVPLSKVLSTDEALKELTKRYFQSHGPAQVIDFVWWSGLLTADAKKGIALNPNIKSDIVEDKTYYFFDRPFKRSTKNVFLLPNYDEYTVAFRDREVLMHNVDKTKLDFRQNSLFNHVVLIDGKVEGVWRRTITSTCVNIETRLFKKLSNNETEQLNTALQEYAEFLNLDLKHNKISS